MKFWKLAVLREAGVVNMKIIPLDKEHYPEVAEIYREGLATGIASFETQVPTWEEWDERFLPIGRWVVIHDKKVAAWCALGTISKRWVYRGVVENTIYVGEKFRNKGAGKKLLLKQIEDAEAHGIWTLQARTFAQNQASIRLHQSCGFKIVGRKEKIGERDGIWHDNIELEYRSKKKYFMKNVLVLCTGNSCRSQMAHGYLKEFGKNKIQVFSAGIETHGLNPGAVSIMKEDGIDISNHTSNHVEEYNGINWDFIITVCDHANENCPFIPAPNAKRLHHNFSDPSKVIGSEEEKHAAFEKARNEIREYCRSFIETNL
ncbi:MAG: GNAT family N-acetyltransferase [Flavobacteriaceae bacterium]